VRIDQVRIDLVRIGLVQIGRTPIDLERAPIVRLRAPPTTIGEPKSAYRRAAAEPASRCNGPLPAGTANSIG
jgi:hypothetical protein